MMKKFNFVLPLVLSVMLGFSSVGVLAGGDGSGCVMTVDTPVVGSFSGSDVEISWTASSECTSPNYNIHYSEGSCDMSPGTDWTSIVSGYSGTSFTWHTSGSPGDGEYCIRVLEAEASPLGIAGFGIMNGTFFVDSVDPVADLFVDYGADSSCYEGDIVTLDASGSSDDSEASGGVLSYSWNLDEDGFYDDATGVSVPYSCRDGGSVESVAVMVSDEAGNSDVASSVVNVVNVPPSCDPIDASDSQLMTGGSVDFVGSATDPAGDLDPLTYSWNFGDSTSGLGSEVGHTFTSAGTYTVVLTVDDGDGGSCEVSHTVEVKDPHTLDDMEVAAYYALDEAFDSLLSGSVSCMEIVDESGKLSIGSDGTDCTVTWDYPKPTNDERGTHGVIVKATSGDGFEYFAFDVVVYSWIIDLHEGWNLISIPLVPEGSNLVEDVILTQLADSFPSEAGFYPVWSYQYDELLGESSWLGSQSDGAGDLDTVMPGYAYWIKVTEDTQLKGFGTQTSSIPGIPPQIEVPTGEWTFIGRYGIVGDGYVAGPLALNSALISIDNEDNELSVYDMDAETLSLQSVDALDNGRGYLLWIDDNGIFPSISETYSPAGDGHYTYN